MMNVEGVPIPVELEHEAINLQDHEAATRLIEEYIAADPKRVEARNAYRAARVQQTERSARPLPPTAEEFLSTITPPVEE